VTAERRDLSAALVDAIQAEMGLPDTDDRVWVMALDLRDRVGTADVLAADDVVWFTGQRMELASGSRYPTTGTMQMTFKKKP
jgi:hypothetical protein